MKTALAFSGGRDSLALLLHMEALWSVLDVVSVDAGDAYPHALAMMEIAQAMVPNYMRIRTDARTWRRTHGDPTDRNWTRCCSANFWEPMRRHLVAGGYKQVLRGDRADEGHIQMVMPGTVLDGVLYTFPLWNWTVREVDEYLERRAVLAEPYRLGADALPDCRSCTATAVCGGRTRHLWEEA